MKKYRGKKLMILILFMLFLLPRESFADEITKSPDYIDIGLFFQETSKSTVSLSSSTGFEIGEFTNGDFLPFLDLPRETNIVLRSNSHPTSNAANPIFIKNEGKFWDVFINSTPTLTGIQVLTAGGELLFIFDSTKDVYFRAIDVGEKVSTVSVEGVQYRGSIMAKRLNGEDMIIINKLPLEEYLYGVVPGEMPALWPLEALKAQAITVRGYALANRNRFRSLGFDLCNTTKSQYYGGFDREHPNSSLAVDETRGQVLTYNGDIISTFYHSNSGGYTEDSENVWFEYLPYLRGIKDKFSLGHANSSWVMTLTGDQISSLLQNRNIFIGKILDIQIISKSPNGRVLELLIKGSKDNIILTKEEVRTVLGLKSAWFTISGSEKATGGLRDKVFMIKGNSDKHEVNTMKGKYIVSLKGIDEIYNVHNIKIFDGRNYVDAADYSAIDKLPHDSKDYYEIVGRGHGHGLGMSQWGAKRMAEEGYNYIDILTYYYMDTRVEMY